MFRSTLSKIFQEFGNLCRYGKNKKIMKKKNRVFWLVEKIMIQVSCSWGKISKITSIICLNLKLNLSLRKMGRLKRLKPPKIAQGIEVRVNIRVKNPFCTGKKIFFFSKNFAKKQKFLKNFFKEKKFPSSKTQ